MKKEKKHNDNATLVDVQLERAFLSALVSDSYATKIVRELQGEIVDDDFTDGEWRKVWRICVDLATNGQEITPLNLYTREPGIEISRLINTTTAMPDTQAIGRMLHDMGTRRRIAEAVEDVYMSLMHDSEITAPEVVAELEAITSKATKQSSEQVESFSTVYRELLTVTQDKANGVLPQGIPSGIRLIDNKGGLELGELMVVAGRNSNGKTSLALGLALNAAKQGVPVGIFSLEMTNLQLTSRLVSMLSGVDGTSLKQGQLTPVEWDGITQVDDSLPLYFDKRRSTDADALVANIKGLVARKGVKVVVIDYLQLLRGKERERVQQIGGIAHRLEALSKQLGICIILLSQLRRNMPNDPAPKLEELKESGDIADAADSIYLVYRPERHGEDITYPDMSQNWSQFSTKGTALLMCCKNRQGALNGEQLLGFDAATTCFSNINNIDYLSLGDSALPSTEDVFND